jgi:hypothetical protein
MKRLLLATVFAVAFSAPAFAGTVTITGAGFANLPASPPAGWPANVVWPGGGSPNGTKAYTISDADWLILLTWVASANPQLATVPPQTPPTAPQILLAWVQNWINGTISAVQQYHTAAPVPPPPISIQ